EGGFHLAVLREHVGEQPKEIRLEVLRAQRSNGRDSFVRAREPLCHEARLGQRPPTRDGGPRLELDEPLFAREGGGRLGARLRCPPVAAELIETGCVQKGMSFAEWVLERPGELKRLLALAGRLLRLAGELERPCAVSERTDGGIVMAVDRCERRVSEG